MYVFIGLWMYECKFVVDFETAMLMNEALATGKRSPRRTRFWIPGCGFDRMTASKNSHQVVGQK